MYLFIIASLLILIGNPAYSQTISHQNWQTQTIVNDTVTVDCAQLKLPFELGRLLVEDRPTVSRGEMDQSLRSSHPMKIMLQPESGSADDLTTISGCTIDGARIQLATADVSDTITVKHTPGFIEFADALDVVLDNRLKILTLQRKAGIWVADGGLGAGGGGTTNLANACSLGEAVTIGCTSADVGYRFYNDGGGMVQECFAGSSTCNYDISIASGNNFLLTLNGTPQLTISSAGAVTLGAAMEERKVMSFPAGMLVVDNAQCIKATGVTLNAEVFSASITCTDNNAASIYFEFPAPEAWDEAELSLTGVFFQEDSSPDGVLEIDWTAYCAGHSDPFGHNTFTAETSNGTMSLTASGLALNDLGYAATTGNIPIGSCTEGDMVRVRGQVDATATTAATPADIHLLYVKAYLKFNDWSN
jgi:hypothetical protein